MSPTASTHVYRTVAGCPLNVDVYRPAQASRPPVVAFLHGGALIWGTRRSVPGWLIDALCGRGIAVASFDYRLAPETKLGEIVTDIRSALAWLGGLGGESLSLNGSRLAVAGASAGGYLALLCGTFEPSPKAVVSLYGYGDILGEWYSRPSAHYCAMPLVDEVAAAAVVGDQPISEAGFDRFTYYLRTRQQASWVQAVAGVDSATAAESLARFCPARNVGADYPPTLLVHGDADTDVPWEQSAGMAEAIRAAGGQAELLTMPGRGHAFDHDADAADVKAMSVRVGEFLSRILL